MVIDLTVLNSCNVYPNEHLTLSMDTKAFKDLTKSQGDIYTRVLFYELMPVTTHLL